MALDLTAVCDGLAYVISTVPNLYVYADDPWNDGPGPNYPCAVVKLTSATYHETFQSQVTRNAVAQLEGTVEVRTAGYGVSAQRTIKGLLSSGTGGSIVDAIELDSSGFGGAVDPGSVIVTGFTGIVVVEDGLSGSSWLQASLVWQATKRRSG